MDFSNSIIAPDSGSQALDNDRQDFEKISCSILLTGFSEDDIFEIVLSLAVRPALVQALRTGLEFGHIILENQTLIEIITGTFSPQNAVGISTTRVPDFTAKPFEAPRFAAAGTGYHFLGGLDQIYQAVDADETMHSMTYSKGEVFSARVSPGTKEFFATYAPMEVTAESNFTIIFKARMEPLSTSFLLSSILGVEFNRSFSTSSTTSDSFSGYGTSTPSSSAHFMDSEGDTLHLDPMSTYLLPTSQSPQPDSPASSCTSPSPSPRTLKHRGRSASVLKITTVIESLLTTLDPPFQISAFRAAEFDRSGGANILVMIQNFTAMQDLLAAFGLTQLKKVVVFIDAAGIQHQLSGIKVLKARNWTDKTFTNKRSKFLIAEMAAKMQWKGDVPDKGSVERKAYNQWQGAVYLWSACGPVVTGRPADAKSSNEQEQHAACPNQVVIEDIGLCLLNCAPGHIGVRKALNIWEITDRTCMNDLVRVWLRSIRMNPSPEAK
ncbi:hypothetical protein C8F04DRAFT_1182028 [Mycena alexandri]|uniref:Uncharacterized protein n=1 Tax=Mycena alexandri TaxID=1745969 RepID=A0AAD6X3X1_9AGAR|nr:hypothetical protein C8F04DRAFT_1182028 [Mycena alexandri]